MRLVPMRLVLLLSLASFTACVQGVKLAIEARIAQHVLEHRKDLLTATPQEGITRGSVTGQATAPGFDHPDEYITVFPTQVAANMEPVILHPDQDAQLRDKLAALRAKTGRRPNLLIFLMDDVGWMDPGFNGGGAALGNATPNMNRLANEGLVLTSAYSTPSCTPTRATIHTGQNPLHHGLLRPPMYGEKGGIDGSSTFPRILQKLGYTTQGVGKWHLGENEESLPQNSGYDDYYGFLGVSDMYTEWRDQYFNPEVALSPRRFSLLSILPFDHSNVHCTPEERKKCEDVYEINLSSLKGLDDDWVAHSVSFLRSRARSDSPWFLYHATRGCHFDNYPTDDYAGRSRARTVYSDCLVQMDDILGTLVDTLAETGQLENTLIFVTSDNGPECEIPPHGRTPFRGCKGSSWEGGVRVPTFAYWKGVIGAGRSDGLFDLADLFNTAISLAGTSGAGIGKAAGPRYVDGIDQLSFLVGDEHLSNRRSRIYTLNQYLAGVRIDEFKASATLELEHAIFDRGSTGGFSGAIVTETGGAVVTNLYTNPQEDVSVGVRHIPMAVMLAAEGQRYQKVLEKYPISIKVGFSGN